MHRRLVLILEELIGALDPAADRGHEPRVEQEMHGDTCSGAGGGGASAHAKAFCVHPLPRFDGDIKMPCRVRNVGKKGQIRRCQRPDCISLRQEIVRALPVAVRRGGASVRNSGNFYRNQLCHA